MLKSFKYLFYKKSKYYEPILKNKIIKNKIIIKKKKNSITFDRIKVLHGDINANGYLFNGIVYISDCSSISTVNLKKILNPNLLILDCLKYKKHATHLNFNKSLYYINKIKPKKTILTNLHSDIDYSSFKKKLEMISKKIVPAFDGLRVKI